MRKKLFIRLILLSVFAFPLKSCTTDDTVSSLQIEKEKITFFDRFEKKNSLSKNTTSINYALPFAQCIQAYFLRHPQKKTEIETQYGIIDLKVSSQDIDDDNDGRKLLFFPILKNGTVTAVIGGVVNGERDYLYFDIHAGGHPDVYYLLNKFQQYYNTQTLHKNSNNPHDIEEVIIIVTKPVKLSHYDGWSGNGGLGNDGHDMGGGNDDFGGNGGMGNPNSTTDPCIVAQQGNDTAKTISENSEFQNKKATAIIGITNSGPEKGYLFGKDTNGNIKIGDIKTGTNTGVNLPPTDPAFTVTGSVHTHPGEDGFDSFSPLDFYGMGNNYTANSNFSMMFVFGATGAEYSLVITDPVKLKNFINLYKQAMNIGGDNGWVKGSVIEVYFMNAIRQFVRQGKTTDEAYALANASVLKKFDTGIAISKKDTDAKFKTIFVNESKNETNPDESNYEQTANCNL